MKKAIFKLIESASNLDRVFIEWARQDCQYLGVTVEFHEDTREIKAEAPNINTLVYFANRLGHRGILAVCKEVS